MSNLEAYEISLLNTLEQDYGLRHGLALDLVIQDRGWGNEGSDSGQQQALDRLVMMAIEVLWSTP